jgi:hypothetical protein
MAEQALNWRIVQLLASPAGRAALTGWTTNKRDGQYERVGPGLQEGGELGHDVRR